MNGVTTGVLGLVLGLVLGIGAGRMIWTTQGTATDSKANAPVAAANPPAAAPEAAAQPQQRQVLSQTVFKVPLEESPSKGPADALVTLVEFTDFQCPFCSRASATVKQVQEDYGNQLRVVVKQHPLPFHPRARPAALASLAAQQQGKFFEYHDKLFANQASLDDASLETFAKEVGLDVKRWKKDMADPKLAAIVDRDSALAESLGARGTPGFFVNGRFFSGAQPIEVFRAAIDEELARAKMMVSEGMKPSEIYASVLAHGVSAPPPPPEAPVQKVDLGTAPVKGSSDAPVTLVAFSDFECPFCSRAANTVKQMEEEYKGKLRVAFKHQPLARHQNAKIAAAASMAAHEQGKFWEMHDKLFANQTALDRPALEKYAQELGLDLGKFKASLDSNKFDDYITKDSAQGTQLGASGTPTFFINGRQIVGAKPPEVFRRVIDEELKKAGVAAAGTP